MGQAEWRRPPLGHFGHGISVDASGHAYVTGFISGSSTFGSGEPNETTLTSAGGYDIFLAKYLNDTAVNVPPVANNQTVTTPEDAPLSITLTATDANGNTLTYHVVTGPSHGTLSIGTLPVLTYTPNQYYSGPDSFTFRAFDGTDFSNVATVTIAVMPVNNAPVAYHQALTTPEDTPLGVTLTGLDVDGNSLFFNVVTGPSHGVLTNTPPTVTYTPNLDYLGPDSFTFTAFDGAAYSLPATVAITVGPTDLACGTLIPGRISAAGEIDRFSFTGQAGQIISLALASTGGFGSTRSNSNSATLTLFAPSGAALGGLRSNDQGNFTLPVAGLYVIQVSATNLATTGSYNLNRECLFPPSPDTVPLTCGARSAGTIEAPGDVDQFSFTGQAGQIISLALASTGGFGSTRSNSDSATLTLFAPSGAALGGLRSNDQRNFTLPTSGTYVIQVSATNLATTGSYNLNRECLFPPSPDTVPLTCGARSAGTIEAPGDVDQFSFTGQAGQIISLALASTGGFGSTRSNSNSATLTLFAPSGAALGGLRSNDQRNFTLPTSGTYVIQVNATNLATVGSYELRLTCP